MTRNFGLEEYVEILSDDVVAHMKSLAQEPGFVAVTRKSYKIDTWTLAYLRRLKLIRDMLDTLSDVGDVNAKAKIRPYDKELAKYERRLLNNVADQTVTESYTNTENSSRKTGAISTVKVSKDLIRNCSDLVHGTKSKPGTGPPRKRRPSLGDAVLR